MKDETKKNTSDGVPSEVNKKDEYLAYIVWRSIPALMKFPPKDYKGQTPNPREFAESMGIEDDQFLDLVGIRTKTAFAERFNLERGTLCDWDKLIDKRDVLSDVKKWASQLSKNMMLAMYNHGVKKGNPAVMKLYMQIANDWTERSIVEQKHGILVSDETQKTADDALLNFLNKKS